MIDPLAADRLRSVAAGLGYDRRRVLCDLNGYHVITPTYLIAGRDSARPNRMPTSSDMQIPLWQRPIFLLFLFSGLVPGSTRAQVAEVEEGESIKVIEVRPAANEILPDLVAAVNAIVNSTNDFRHSEGQQNVEINLELTKTAQYFADFMASTNKYGHQADGQRPGERAKKHDYAYCIVSENIAYQFNSAGFTTEELAMGFFQGWKDSADHRKNMLDADIAQTGVAVARSKESGYYYAVQMFGRPKSMSIEFQVTNDSDTELQYVIGVRTFPLPPRLTRTHQHCRPTALTIQWPEEQESTALQPSSGDHYTIVREDSGKFNVGKD